MKFSYNWLKELVPFNDSPQTLADFLTMRVFEVESVERAQGAGGDWTLDIKVLPNRMADASGHIGMAREIAALKNIPLKIKTAGREPADMRMRAGGRASRNTPRIKIRVDDAQDCPRYTARVMTDIAPGPSPAWLRERLAVCGLQSVNNLVDMANYVMLEYGQPLHVFDYDAIGGGDGRQKIIRVRRARAGEVMPALDDKTYALDPDVLVVADAESPIAIAGIKGGKGSGVSDTTRAIVIEAANFAPARIRRASQALGLRTDASVRFEHGLDPEATASAADRLADLIREITGQGVCVARTDAYPRKEKPVTIAFRPEDAARLIGAEIPASFYPQAFRRLGWRATKKGAGFAVTPPTLRRDIRIAEDITEEIARLWDYNRIPARLPSMTYTLPGRKTDALFQEERLRDSAVGAGLAESILSRFTSDAQLEVYSIARDHLLSLRNPAGPDAQYMTPRAVMGYVSSAAENLRITEDVGIFGIAKNFTAEDGGMVPGARERAVLIIAVARKNDSDGAIFYRLKGMVDYLLASAGVGGRTYRPIPPGGESRAAAGIYHPWRRAEIRAEDTAVAVMGEISPAILKNIKARGRIAAAEIDMERLAKIADAGIAYRPVGRYPAIIRDIAVIVPETTQTDDALAVIRDAGAPLLAGTDPFDYFQDETLAAGAQKSIAFHLTFQSPERTLTDAEVDGIMRRIRDALEAQNWEIKR
jgi:phenylalanyl-tRNA synthetase beta chain